MRDLGAKTGTHLHDLVPAWVEGILQPVDKLEVHLRGLRHLAVSVFLRRGDQVLLQKRAAGKYHTPGLWANTCCTHPLWGEAADHCAIRRLREELGIADVTLRPVGAVEYRADVGRGMIEHELVQVFVGEVGPDLPLILDPDEVEATRWVTLPDLRTEMAADPGVFTPWLRIYLTDHETQIFGA